MTSSEPVETTEPVSGPPAHLMKRFRPDGQMDDKLGLVMRDWNPQRLVATMPVAGNIQPMGLLHGGASAAMAESLGSMGAAVNSPAGTYSVGIQLQATHHRSATSGTVTGVATPIHLGRTLKTFQIVITDDAGNRCCTAQLTAMTLPGKPGPK
ncbi:uncharacterized protein (TIGR00369 family) [Antricoccus suffuscus]|uniref:Uncharacterized protein (TIGR00369 family) n=1 Tax=Antricoccus suffuscus TaxID=1629062 RepID=A0A2T0ZWF5_9ACTN|nr:hotdog fold thioesterase [Antricoccus suffuscus]PRZ40587.1 uncharacterized protein (TIGR00369 family) [Antricoccus suffuscus]